MSVSSNVLIANFYGQEAADVVEKLFGNARKWCQRNVLRNGHFVNSKVPSVSNVRKCSRNRLLLMFEGPPDDQPKVEGPALWVSFERGPTSSPIGCSAKTRHIQYFRTISRPRLSENAAKSLQETYVKIRQDMRQHANETWKSTPLPKMSDNWKL
ncbi:hypothetical protein Tco_1195707 [Tanacetum coccineum]